MNQHPLHVVLPHLSNLNYDHSYLFRLPCRHNSSWSHFCTSSSAKPPKQARQNELGKPSLPTMESTRPLQKGIHGSFIELVSLSSSLKTSIAHHNFPSSMPDERYVLRSHGADIYGQTSVDKILCAMARFGLRTQEEVETAVRELYIYLKFTVWQRALAICVRRYMSPTYMESFAICAFSFLPCSVLPRSTRWLCRQMFELLRRFMSLVVSVNTLVVRARGWKRRRKGKFTIPIKCELSRREVD